MGSGSDQPLYTLEIAGVPYQLNEAALTGVLFDIVSTLVFEKHATRITYILKGSDSQLSGSGSGEITALGISLYRHLKEQRCPGPPYAELGAEAQSFRLHSIVDALVAVAFFLKADDLVPHFIVGDDVGGDLLTVLNRGREARLMIEDPALRSKLSRLVPGADAS